MIKSTSKLPCRIVKKNFCFTFNCAEKLWISNDLNVAKKQVLWKIRNIDNFDHQKILMNYFDRNADSMSLEDLKRLSSEILEKSSIDKQRIFQEKKLFNIQSNLL